MVIDDFLDLQILLLLAQYTTSKGLFYSQFVQIYINKIMNHTLILQHLKPKMQLFFNEHSLAIPLRIEDQSSFTTQWIIYFIESYGVLFVLQNYRQREGIIISKMKPDLQYTRLSKSKDHQFHLGAKLFIGQSSLLSLYFRLQFQMTNTNYIILLFVAVLLLIQTSISYRLMTGKTAIVEKELDAIFKNKTQAANNVTSYYRFFIFPYDVYEYHTNDTTNNTYTRNFIFIKSAYEYIQSLMDVQNSTLDMQNQIKILYDRIPQIIHVMGQNNEQIEIELIDINLECKQFVIRNSTSDKIQNTVRIYDLNFYYLQINKYLLKVINVAYYKMSQNETKTLFDEEEQSIFQGMKGRNFDTLKKHKFVLENILANDTLWESEDFTNYLVYRIFSRKIRQTTKWKAIYDGFTIKYFSGDIYRTNVDSPSDDDYIELVRIQVGEGEIKQSKIIKQPLKYLKLSELDFVDLCRCGEKINVLFADKTQGYVIDITKEQWHLLQQIKVASNMSELQSVFFGKDCKVYGLHQRSQLVNNSTAFRYLAVLQYYPKKQQVKQINTLITHFFQPLLNMIIFCDAKNNCSVFDTQKFKEISKELTTNATFLTINNKQNVQFRLLVKEGKVKYFWQIIDRQEKRQRLIEILSSNKLMNYFSSSQLHPIYSSLVYRNKTKYISNEMNREVYEHIKEDFFLQNNKLKQSYYQEIFNEKVEGEECLVPFDFEPTIAQVKFSQTNRWSVCVWEQEINQYTELIMTFKERYLNYQLYLCSSFLELYSERMNIECITLLDQNGQFAQTKTLSLIEQLRSSHFYKLYIVKHNQVQQKNLPNIYVKDVQRQQIQVASTIFFFIMIVLSLFLLGLVLFITLKSVVINLLIYYGFIQERVQPTYPLAWFPLKTKLKRMQQHGVLKYVEYEPSFSDTQGNHCCFCLELVRQKTMVAQIYCGHEFHKQCFKQWIKNQPNAKCPTCRRHFTRIGLLQYHSSMSTHQQISI